MLAAWSATLASPRRGGFVSVEIEADGDSLTTHLAHEVAERCSRTQRCLQRAEKAIRSGQLGKACTTLGFHHRTGDVMGGPQWPDDTRWLNAAGMVALLKGDVVVATSLLRRAVLDTVPFGPTHLPVRINLYWAAHLEPSPSGALDGRATLFDRVQQAKQDVVDAFRMTHERTTTRQPGFGHFRVPRGSLKQAGPTVFDLSVARRVCDYPLYDRHRRHRPGLWAGVGGGSAVWMQRYLDLMKRSLTRYLTRDLDDEVRQAASTGLDAEAVRAACERRGNCDAPWHMGQGAQQEQRVGAIGGPFSQKYASGLVHLEVRHSVRNPCHIERVRETSLIERPAHGSRCTLSALTRALRSRSAPPGAHEHAAARPRRGRRGRGGVLYRRHRCLAACHARSRPTCSRW